MKDNVFIAWSGNKKLAIKIQSLLKQRGYLCFVGGDYKDNPTDIDFSGNERSAINNTIRNQINYCNHAIVLIQKRTTKTSTQTTMISGNLCYELGYLNAKYPPSNIHIFFIDFVSSADEALPSDIHGAWGVPISSKKKTNENLANEIVAAFIDRKNITIYKSRIQDINYSRHIDYAIDVHLKHQPIYSDYELAKRLLFYVQAAFIYQEWEEPKRKCIRLYEYITQNEREKITELDIVLEYALLTFELFDKAIPSESKKTSISGTDFRDMLKKYRAIVSLLLKEERDDQYCLSNINIDKISTNTSSKEPILNDEFKIWFVPQVQQHVTYLFSAFFNSDTFDRLPSNDKTNYLNEAEGIGLTAVNNLKEIEKNPSNSAYAILLLGYVHRNLAYFYKLLNNEKRSNEHQRLSYNMRNKLYENKNRSWNIDLQNYISLEYFLQKLENLEDEPNLIEWDDAIAHTEKFIQETEKYYNSKKLMFSQLEETLAHIKNTKPSSV